MGRVPTLKKGSIGAVVDLDGASVPLRAYRLIIRSFLKVSCILLGHKYYPLG